MLPSAPEVDAGGEISRARPPTQLRRSIISPPLVLRRARLKTAAGHTREHRRHLFRLFRACLSFSPRVVNSTDQITKLGRLTRPLVRFLRHLWRLLRAISRYRNSENDGRFAWMAWSLNHIATTDLRAARMKSATGHMSEAAGPRRRLARAFRAGWRLFWPGDQVSRKVNRGLDAHAAPGPVYLPASVFSPPTWSLLPEK